MNTKTCPHCLKELTFDKPQKFGAHIVNCNSNPKKLDRINKIISSTTLKRETIELACVICKKPYKLNLLPSLIKRKKYRTTCSVLCSHKRTQTENTKIKISKKLTGKLLSETTKSKISQSLLRKNNNNSPRFKQVNCIICNKVFEIENYKNKKSCSKNCLSKICSQNKQGNKNPMFGLAPKNSNYSKGYFFSQKTQKQIYYRSSYEFKTLNILEDDNTVIKYDYECMKIPYNNSSRNTIPDFIVYYNNGDVKMIEVKCTGLLTKFNNPVKIKAMKEYCNLNNIIFEIWTEQQLFKI